jgi:poly(3-hydroxyalkanoate) synthetase
LNKGHLVLQNRFMRLYCHQQGTGTPAVILNPFAGHARIAGGTGRHSIVETLCKTDKPVWEVEPLGCHPDDDDRGYEWWIENINLALTIANPSGPVSLWGMCQGGPVSLLTAAIHPDKVSRLITIASPNNTSPSGSILDRAIKWPVNVMHYHALLGYLRFKHPWARGNMPCLHLVNGWRSTNAPLWERRERDRDYDGLTQWYNQPAGSHEDYDDGKGVIGRGIYLEMIRNFLGNNIATNNLHVDGKHIDLSAIQCPVTVLQGKDDEVCPGHDDPEQSWGWLGEAVPHARYVGIAGNHLGTMIGREAQTTIAAVAA